MANQINHLYLGLTNYKDALEFQEFVFNAQLEKLEKGEKTANNLILLEHEHVYTLGKSGDIKNLKVPIEETGAEYFETNRGGDITYHGPGQLVGYPIFNLADFNLSVREFVYTIEECVIETVASYGIKCERIEGVSGVWVGADTKIPRKICALGIKVSRRITMHGFAMNVDPNLSFFENIVPCGLEDKGVTSLRKELGKEVDMFDLMDRLIKYFEKHFN